MMMYLPKKKVIDDDLEYCHVSSILLLRSMSLGKTLDSHMRRSLLFIYISRRPTQIIIL